MSNYSRYEYAMTKYQVAWNFLHYLSNINSQQFRSIRGMLNSGNEEAERSARNFIKSKAYEEYPTDKDKFYFQFNGRGWSIVDEI